MTDHVRSSAARAPRKRDETAQRDGRHRSRRTTLTDRDLAELEALLTEDLQRSPSPPIAAEDGDSEQSEQSLSDTEWAPRPTPARRMPRPETRDRDENVHRHDPAREPGFAPRLRRPEHRAPPGAMPRVDQRLLVTRAMRVGAIAFNVVALVGVSALLVLLAVRGEWAATPTAEDPARVGQSAVAVPPLSTERGDAPVVTGSTEVKQDTSRGPSQGYPAARGGGIARAVDTPEAAARTPQPPASAPALTEPDASTAAARESPRGVLAAGTAFSPPPDNQYPAPRESEPSKFGAAPAAEEAGAPMETAATKFDDRSAEPARRQSGEPAAATRSAPVTTHVNMRASADNDAAVVAVVPAGKNVGVVKCSEWCEVVYGEQQGFIHRKFVSGAKK